MTTIDRLTETLRQKEQARDRAEEALRAAEAAHAAAEQRFATEPAGAGYINTPSGRRSPASLDLEKVETALREAKARLSGARTEADAFRQFADSDDTRQKAAELDRLIESHPRFEDAVEDHYAELVSLGRRIGELFSDLRDKCRGHQTTAADIRDRSRALGLEPTAGFPPAWPDVQRRIARSIAAGIASLGLSWADLDRALEISRAGRDLRSDDLERSRRQAAERAREQEAADARRKARDRIISKIHEGASLDLYDREWAERLGIDVAAEMREARPRPRVNVGRYASDDRPSKSKPNGAKKPKRESRVTVIGGDAG